MTLRRRSLVLVFSLLAACASAPVPEGPAPEASPPPELAAPPPPPAPVEPPTGSLFCGLPGLRRVALADLGLPEGSRARDVALTAKTIWVLVEPATLVGFPRKAREVEEVETVEGRKGESWDALAVDPVDDSVWIASGVSPNLKRKRPGRWIETVKVAAPQPAGSGFRGFRDVAVSRDGVYAVPACAGAAVWKLDRSGKLLRSDFPEEAPGACPAADLESDWNREVWALRSGGLFWLGRSGAWEPAPDGLAVPLPADPRDARWFFWSGQPRALGPWPGDEEGNPVLYRWENGQVALSREDCGAGNPLLKVVGDGRGWVVLTRGALLLGDFPEPEPPAPAGSE